MESCTEHIWASCRGNRNGCVVILNQIFTIGTVWSFDIVMELHLLEMQFMKMRYFSPLVLPTFFASIDNSFRNMSQFSTSGWGRSNCTLVRKPMCYTTWFTDHFFGCMCECACEMNDRHRCSISEGKRFGKQSFLIFCLKV